jgi:hypothetical protein
MMANIISLACRPHKELASEFFAHGGMDADMLRHSNDS